MSPIITPDLSEVNKPIDPGTYEAKIISVEAKTSKNDNPMIVAKFQIDASGKEYYRNSYMVITGAGAFNFEQLLRATHFDDVANSMKSGSPVPFDTDNLIGQEVIVVIESDVYNGAITDKIKSFLPK